MNKIERMRGIVAQGWTAMFIVSLGNLVMDMIRTAAEGSQARWVEHFGPQGVQFVLIVLSVYAVMPMLVRTLSARWFRGVVVGVTALMTLFVGAHEVVHVAANDKPFGVIHALDITHHILGVWTLVAAIMWARQPDYVQSSAANRAAGSQKEGAFSSEAA